MSVLAFVLRECPPVTQYAEVFKAIHKTSKAVVGKGEARAYRAASCVAARCARVAAVKFIDKKALTPEDLAALEIEVKAMEILSSHSNFVRLYDFFAEKVRRWQAAVWQLCRRLTHLPLHVQDFFYVCMELISGGELFDRIVQKEKYTERGACFSTIRCSCRAQPQPAGGRLCPAPHVPPRRGSRNIQAAHGCHCIRALQGRRAPGPQGGRGTRDHSQGAPHMTDLRCATCQWNP